MHRVDIQPVAWQLSSAFGFDMGYDCDEDATGVWINQTRVMGAKAQSRAMAFEILVTVRRFMHRELPSSLLDGGIWFLRAAHYA